MSKSTLSILGLYSFDPSIFDGFMVPSGVDKQGVIDTILLNCAELEILYSDPDFMKGAIANWSLRNQTKWYKLYQTVVVSYDPIENYNRYEERGEVITPNTETITGVSAFNSPSFENASKTHVTGESHSDITSHMHGNIGVTTSQQMLEAERKLQDWTIYDFIAEDFKNMFCLLVY